MTFFTGVAVGPDGDLDVVDTENHALYRFSPAGQCLAAYQIEGLDPADWLNCVATDDQGNLYVADRSAARIVKLSPTGQPLAQWGCPGAAPASSAAQRASRSTARATSTWPTPATAASRSSLRRASRWRSGGRGDCPGQFQFLLAVAGDGDGDIFVADEISGQVQKLAPAGQPLARWGNPGPGRFSYLYGIAIGGAGDLFLADDGDLLAQGAVTPNGYAVARVLRLSPQGLATGQ